MQSNLNMSRVVYHLLKILFCISWKIQTANNKNKLTTSNINTDEFPVWWNFVNYCNIVRSPTKNQKESIYILRKTAGGWHGPGHTTHPGWTMLWTETLQTLDCQHLLEMDLVNIEQGFVHCHLPIRICSQKVFFNCWFKWLYNVSLLSMSSVTLWQWHL